MKFLQLFNRLGTRLTLIITLTGSFMFFLFMNLAYFGELFFGGSHEQNILWTILATLTIPMTMGFVAAFYVNRYLSKFASLINELSVKNNETLVTYTGIIEFDNLALRFKELQKQLAEAEELRKNLIMNASHEFNTPLMALTAQVSAMKDGLLPISLARVSRLEAHIKRLNILVDNLHAYTKAQLPQTIEPSPVNVRTTAESIREQFGEQWRKRNVTLVVNVPKTFTIHCNPHIINQIFANLIENALRHSGGSCIEIGKTTDGFYISDDGRGVGEKHLRHIFERFYRVEESHKYATEGMGLGLAIVYELARTQGWEVVAENNHPGLRIRFITFHA